MPEMKFSKLSVCVFVFVSMISVVSQAVIRPIIIPGKSGMIMLQAVSSAGGGKIDPEPRALYDAIALPEQDGPSGGKGKVIGTAEKDFNLTCAFKSVVTPLNVLCTIVVKPSTRSKISMNEVEIVVEGPEALELYEKVAGPNATDPWLWSTENGWISFDSRPERFVYRFQR